MLIIKLDRLISWISTRNRIHTHMLILQCVQTNESTINLQNVIMQCSYEIYKSSIIWFSQINFCAVFVWLLESQSILTREAKCVCVCIFVLQIKNHSVSLVTMPIRCYWSEKTHCRRRPHTSHFYDELIQKIIMNEWEFIVKTEWVYKPIRPLHTKFWKKNCFLFLILLFLYISWFECLSMCVYARAYFS